jgi:hypothetical protein
MQVRDIDNSKKSNELGILRAKSQTALNIKRMDSGYHEILSYEKTKKDFQVVLDKINALRDIHFENIAKLKIRDVYISKLRAKAIQKSFVSTIPSQYDTKLLSEYVPRWIPDSSVKVCTFCDRLFTFLTRKHHCRVCGDIFCARCCNKFEKFTPFYRNKVRMCETCFKDKKYIII